MNTPSVKAGTATTGQIIAAADAAAGALRLHCIVCGASILDPRRVRRGQHTCSQLCQAAYRKFRRNLIAHFKCRLCGRPNRERVSGNPASQRPEFKPVRSEHKPIQVEV